jgi:superfamily II DNA/RNA helicase
LQILDAEHAERDRKHIKTLILTPTRELAIQIDESFRAYGKYVDLKHLVIFGGVSQFSQVQAIRRGVDILVATPGRLLDLMNQRHVSLQDIKFFVLDEADRMLDMGFLPDIRQVVRLLPKQRQTLLFSATLPDEIKELARSVQRDPVRVEVGLRRTPAAGVDGPVVVMLTKQCRTLAVPPLFQRRKQGVLPAHIVDTPDDLRLVPAFDALRPHFPVAFVLCHVQAVNHGHPSREFALRFYLHEVRRFRCHD